MDSIIDYNPIEIETHDHKEHKISLRNPFNLRNLKNSTSPVRIIDIFKPIAMRSISHGPWVPVFVVFKIFFFLWKSTNVAKEMNCFYFSDIKNKIHRIIK